MNHRTASLLSLSLFTFLSALPMSHASAEREFAERIVTFSGEDRPYTEADVLRDFGNGRLPERRAYASVHDDALRVLFRDGTKVLDTGLALHVRVPPGDVYEVFFRMRYPESFEAGMHGKMIGLSGGRGYDGGRGDEARGKGDGWSLRLQFDVRPEDIRKTLYLYHAGMEGRYGGPHGATPFFIERGRWYDFRIRVSMQSSPEAGEGRIEVWCDEAKRIDVEGIRFVSREEGRMIDRVRFELFPGGAGHTPTMDHPVDFQSFGWRRVR